LGFFDNTSNFILNIFLENDERLLLIGRSIEWKFLIIAMEGNFFIDIPALQ
jgi:hypothetical protein